MVLVCRDEKLLTQLMVEVNNPRLMISMLMLSRKGGSAGEYCHYRSLVIS